ncbi:MAG: PP2C family protein-serine/threonine phosphatase [Lachnospiraceae bacterium]|nr:PP2C family protein-serine/threonine phosphatase [Lachnospiraceae bacterium]
MKNQKKHSLASRFIIGFFVIGVVLSAMALTFSYSGFKRSMQQQYHDTAYLIADTADSFISDYIPVDRMEEIVEAAKNGDEAALKEITESEDYKTVYKDLNELREKMGLTDIYITYYVPEELRAYANGDDSIKPLLYIFDTYYNADEVYPIGTRSTMNKKNIELFAEVVEKKTTQSKFIISNGDFGYNISALKPILNDSGDVVCVIAVEEPMRLIESATKEFVIRTVGELLIAILFIMVFFVLYLYKKVVEPVNLVAKEAARFGAKNERTEESVWRLQSIKTKDEIQTLAENIDKMEQDMLNYVTDIQKITAEKERIGAELNVATKIQADMLPRIFPAFPERDDVDLYASMSPAKEVGGDFYDFFMIDDVHLAVVMADVSGKGVPAALFMVIAKTLIKNNMQSEKNVEEALFDSNNELAENNEEMLFVTAWIGVINLQTGQVVYSDAGHEFPLLMHQDGTVEEIHPTEKKMPLATFEGISYIRDEFTMKPGERLFLYTDGVPEATDAHNELYGMDRLEETLSGLVDKTPEEILHKVRENVDAFVGDAPQFDDLTMMAVHYIGQK